MPNRRCWSGICAFLLFVLLASAGAAAQSKEKKAEPPPRSGQSRDALHQLNDSLAALTEKISPAVVQILVTGFGPLGKDDRTAAATVGTQHSIGSGIIVDPAGYIVTNSHVVEDAQRIRVVLSGGTPASPLAAALPAGRRAVFDAQVVGAHEETDIAVLKIEASGLPFLSLNDLSSVRQGELVIAMGSPGGLENSVTMGVVSSVARQPDPDRPGVYIQTDAPINPGNSGGPLVDVDGLLVGINTFILTEGGGSEGLGFAVPGAVVKFVYDEIRQHGHVHRSEIGASAQTITHSMASGLGLSQTWGVIISDVIPGGPAEASGVKVEDIVLSMDGRPVDSLPIFEAGLYLHPTDQKMKLEILRGSDKIALEVPVVEERHDVDRLADIADPGKSLIARFGILAVVLDGRVRKALPDLRSDAGVLVVARVASPGSIDAGLVPGDLICSFNRTPVKSVSQLRTVVDALKAGEAVVMQVERQGRFQYLAFEVE